MKSEIRVWTLNELILASKVKLGRGNIISKKDIASFPGEYPIYSSARKKNGTFGFYGKYMFDEELITWSIDGGGRLFYRPRHKFSVTNVGGTLRILDKDFLDCRYLHLMLTHLHSKIRFDWVYKAHPSVIRAVYNEIPLPSLEKQREIVEKLDSAFTEIDLIEENFDLLDSLINEYDTLVLGRILKSSNDELGKYRSTTLEEVTELISRGISPSYLDSANTVVLNQRCIREGRVDLNFSRRHNEEAKRVQVAKLLKSGDGLINSTGVGTLGRTALFEKSGSGTFTVDSHVTIVRPKRGVLDSNYFGLVLRALENVFVSLSTGTSGQTELPREAIKNTAITFPIALDDQKNFYDYYNSLNTTLNEYRKMLANKRVLTAALHRSLLNSAFSQKEEVG